MRSHLNYADIICDKPDNINICNKIKNFQYNAALVVTGTIRWSLKETLCQEMICGYLSPARWLRKLCLFYKIVLKKSLNCLHNYVSIVNSIKLETLINFYNFFCRTEYFANSFFPDTVKGWNNSSLKIRKLVL